MQDVWNEARAVAVMGMGRGDTRNNTYENLQDALRPNSYGPPTRTLLRRRLSNLILVCGGLEADG
jgi:hypothetical protein